MAKFRYVGGEGFPPEDEISFYGAAFERGEVSEVSDYAAEKLRRHWTEAFEEVTDDEPVKKRGPGRPRLTEEAKAARAAPAKAKKSAVETDLGPDEDWDNA